METIKDRDTLGALAGMGAILIRDAYSLLAKLIGFAKFYVWNRSADIFLQEEQMKTVLGTVVGLLADTTMGALIGVVFVRFLKSGEDKNPILKGLGFGIGAWLFLFGILFHSLPNVNATAVGDAQSNLSAFVGHSIFGLALGLLSLWLLRLTDTRVVRAGK